MSAGFARARRWVIVIGAANRDPAEFRQPDQSRPHRSPNRHVAFGAGPHFCLGASLARLEARSMLTALLAALPTLALAEEEVTWLPTVGFRGPQRLLVRGVIRGVTPLRGLPSARA